MTRVSVSRRRHRQRDDRPSRTHASKQWPANVLPWNPGELVVGVRKSAPQLGGPARGAIAVEVVNSKGF
jgi:hypothetical protein